MAQLTDEEKFQKNLLNTLDDIALSLAVLSGRSKIEEET